MDIKIFFKLKPCNNSLTKRRNKCERCRDPSCSSQICQFWLTSGTMHLVRSMSRTTYHAFTSVEKRSNSSVATRLYARARKQECVCELTAGAVAFRVCDDVAAERKGDARARASSSTKAATSTKLFPSVRAMNLLSVFLPRVNLPDLSLDSAELSARAVPRCHREMRKFTRSLKRSDASMICWRGVPRRKYTRHALAQAFGRRMSPRYFDAVHLAGPPRIWYKVQTATVSSTQTCVSDGEREEKIVRHF